MMYLRRVIRRHYVYHRKKMKSDLHPVWITQKDVKERKCYYEDVVASLTKEMKTYQTEHKPLQKELFVASQKLTDFTVLSYNGDLMGKVFRKGNHIYRGIYKESVSSFMKLWNSGLLQILGAHHYIPVTTITDFYADEYPVIIEHEVVDMNTSKMWNYSMIREACILMCIINQAAQKVGFTLYDGHLNNMTFHKGKPMFTDIGSLVEHTGQKTGFASSMVFAGLYRLLFFEMNHSILKRVQVYDEENNAIWITPMEYDDTTFEYYQTLKRVKRYHRFHSAPLTNYVLFRLFDCYDVKPEYIDLLFAKRVISQQRVALADGDKESQAVIDGLGQANCCDDVNRIVDVGGTAGILPLMIYKEWNKNVITLEYSDSLSEQAYALFQKEQAPIHVLLFQYLYGADESSRAYLQSDLAIALDITHNIIIFQRWKLDSLLNSLSKLSKKYVATTFYPDGDEAEAYENFEREFKNFFTVLYKAPIIMRNKKGVLYIGKK